MHLQLLTSAHFILLLITTLGCNTSSTPESPHATLASAQATAPPATQSPTRTIIQRFPTPSGYIRTAARNTSFATYLRTLPLKPEGSQIGIYDGSQIATIGGHEAVIDLPIGNKDLHQCADAVIRLRAEYLRSHKRDSEIHFNFTNGMRVDWDKWKQGYRMQVKGNKTKWVLSAEPDESYESWWAYLELIFMYAGTASLEKELVPRPYKEMQIGDVFIIGGHPGHAVIIVDMAEKVETGEKLFMVAQSFMPAQELHIISSAEDINPWYSLDKPLNIFSWHFDESDLKRFK